MTCPAHFRADRLEIAINLISGKWKGTILMHLLSGSLRFGELRRLIPKVTQRTLTNHLRDMERKGLLKRTIYAEVPARVEYCIAPMGRTVEPVLIALQVWGERYERFCETADPARLPTGDARSE